MTIELGEFIAAAWLRSRLRSPKAGTGVFSTVDGVPFFLQAAVLKPFITSDLIMSTAPLFYIERSGKKSDAHHWRSPAPKPSGTGRPQNAARVS